jgi:lysyl-tRNA synthetase class 1
MSRSAEIPSAWPFAEAAKVKARMERSGKRDRAVFCAGYGPSGLPHVGTFAEVLRTTWVRNAYSDLTGKESRLVVVGDDMDGLRRVPDNVPDPDAMKPFVGTPLCRIPDPFGTHGSFAAHNMAMLRDFLDGFGFDYEFMAASDLYSSGWYDAALIRALGLADRVADVVIPTLREERSGTYSPFMPIHPVTGKVAMSGVFAHDAENGTVRWRDETGEEFETAVTGGRCKLQWKADWGMRWHEMGVDYEMNGKDLIESVRLSGKICRILGSEPPVSCTVELLLDDQGKKISKSKGNGMTMEEWLALGPSWSLAHFLFPSPGSARKLHRGLVPRAIDDHLAACELARSQEGNDLRGNPAWHVHSGRIVDAPASPVPFAMLLNLAEVSGASGEEEIWNYVRVYRPGLEPRDEPVLADLVRHALAYRAATAGDRSLRAPTESESGALLDLADTLEGLDPATDAEGIQWHVFEVGKRHGFQPLRDWFRTLYQVLLGKDDGPRFGHLAAIYGLERTSALIRAALERAREPGSLAPGS